MGFQNKFDIPLALQVWLVGDNYDFVPDPRYISVTTLLKPTRQIILNRRLETSTNDLSDLLSLRIGTAIHDSIQSAWENNYKENLKKLDYSDSQVEKVIVNPTKEDLQKDIVPIYVEQRATKEFRGWKIGGKFDIVLNGQVQDFKSTSVYTYMLGSRNEDFIWQGSLYKWLNPEKIQEDTMAINFVFTDWSKIEAERDCNYPQTRCAQITLPLKSAGEVENFIRHKLDELETYLDLPEDQLLECPEEELWFPKPSYRYFRDAEKTAGRATRVFDSMQDAIAYKATQGRGSGVILTAKGSPRRCLYCAAASTCSQYQKYK